MVGDSFSIMYHRGEPAVLLIEACPARLKNGMARSSNRRIVPPLIAVSRQWRAAAPHAACISGRRCTCHKIIIQAWARNVDIIKVNLI